MDIPADSPNQPARYNVPKLEGGFTLQELVAMDIAKDPRLSKVRRRDLPEDFWEERRRALNRRRTLRQKASRKARLGAAGEEELEVQYMQQGQQQSGEEGDLKEGLLAPPARAARTEEERQQAVQAHLEQVARVEAALASGLRVAVDCSLCQEGASWREQRSLVKQLQLSVGANRKAPAPLCLHFVGLTGRAREFAVGSMNALRWPAHVSEAPALELFPPSQLVMLSPDAEQPLLELDPEKVYVIGGLVDRSVAKNATARHAEQHGIQCARLPIAEFLGRPKGAAMPRMGEGAAPAATAAAALQRLEEGQQQQQQQRQGQRQQPSMGQQAREEGEAQCAGDEGQLEAQQGSVAQQEDDSQQACQLAGAESASSAAAAHALSALSLGTSSSGHSSGGEQTNSSSSDSSTAATTAPAPAAASTDAQSAARAGACQSPASSMRQAKKKQGNGAAGGFVLNITDVVDILLAVNAGGGWGEALRQAIPLRKQMQRFGSEAALADEGKLEH